MKETDKFNDILFKLLDLSDAPGCFNPDIKEIAKELGYSISEDEVMFWEIIWNDIQSF